MNTKKALVVGIDYYQSLPKLFGCVNDAHSMKVTLERDGTGSINFGTPKLLTSSASTDNCDKQVLKDAIEELFSTDDEIALLYFAGHGHIEASGGYILASDAKRWDDGVSLNEILELARGSKAKNKIIILDSCHSGSAGNPVVTKQEAALSDGMTILTASTDKQRASEENGHGVFTTLLIDALQGSARDLLGNITPGSVYAHIDQSLGNWKQRPVFKTNVKTFVSLRKVEPPIPLADLHRITEFFPTPGFDFKLDPSFEPRDEGRTPEMPRANLENNRKFTILQKYNRVNLLVPVGAEHMWNAAMEGKSCKLTVLGEHYRRLVEEKLI
ncbi:MAG: caspase family protein [Planctomycetes bacterium]|nr:caspase family protein [Planctomycetota bacterium]